MMLTFPSWMDKIILDLTGNAYSSIEELKADCLEQSEPELITQMNTIISVVISLDKMNLIKRPRLSANQIIDETVAYYTEDVSRRTYNPDINNCLYLGANGTKCAYSRCWKEGVYSSSMEQKTPSSLDSDGYTPDYLVQEQYQGHSVKFWNDLQTLHDNPKYWTENNISILGKEFVKELKDTWK
jgi:hypothetical protein